MRFAGIRDRITAALGGSRRARAVLLPLSALLVAAGGYYGAAVPLIRYFQKASLPDFPDCAGRPEAVVKYLRAEHTRAMDQPASDEAVGELGMAYHAHLYYDQAAACYRRAEALNPGNGKWAYYAGLLEEELGDTKATIEALKTVVGKQPANQQAWFRLGNAFLKAHSLPDADSALHRALSLPEAPPLFIGGVRIPAKGAFPLEAYAKLQLARVRLQEKRLDDAAVLLQGVIDANPTFGPAYRLLGNVCREKGEDAEASGFEVRAGDFDSYVPPADVMYNTLVLCSRDIDFITRQIALAVKWENYDWTLALINHILEFSPHDGEALTFKIKLALDTQRLGELGPLVVAYAGQFRSDEPKLIDMARYLKLRGQYEASVALLRNIITLNPGSTEAHLEFVRMLQIFKQYDLGVRYCTEVLAKEPRNGEIRFELADLLIHEGNLDRAEQELEKAQSIHQDDELHSILIARMLQRRGDAGGAVRYFERALAANPRNTGTQLELGKYFVKMRMWKEAAAQCQRALQASPNNIDFIEQCASLKAACPDARIRDGKTALALSERLRLVKKQTVEQDIRCGMALSAAYAETGKYDAALAVARDYLARAKASRNTEYTTQLEAFIRLFESRKPYRM